MNLSHDEYMQYNIEAQSNGQPALSYEDWIRAHIAQAQSQGMTQAPPATIGMLAQSGPNAAPQGQPPPQAMPQGMPGQAPSAQGMAGMQQGQMPAPTIPPAIQALLRWLSGQQQRQ